MVQKASTTLTDMLQKAVAREIQVSVQYMWQHVMAKGLESAAITSFVQHRDAGAPRARNSYDCSNPSKVCIMTRRSRCALRFET